MDIYEILQDCNGFGWDQYNIDKNWEKHKVTPFESEQVFFSKPLIISYDSKHSQHEERYYALGKTDQERTLFLVFTIREKKIRIISSRDTNNRERNFYEKY